MIQTVRTVRYLVPLREGGSLPAVVEADDGELYVLKFVGAGQGAKALIAELIAGEIGRALGLRIPKIVLMDFDPEIARGEPNAEIQDLLRASAGLNLALGYLANAFAYSPVLQPALPATLASEIVWFDAYVTNVDRTIRNTNLLIWQSELWLIDHGAALYFHHNWPGYRERAGASFPLIKDHVLLRYARELDAADATAHSLLDRATLQAIVDAVPSVWLGAGAPFDTHDDHRRAYLAYLVERLHSSQVFVQEAKRARAKLL